MRILFADFSSAFNTIQPHLILSKLSKMCINSNLIRWINSFLIKRPQFVTVNGTRSNVTNLSTGAPQGCVLSPILFIIYTNDCISKAANTFIIKFADDAAIVSLQESADLEYRNVVNSFISWCKENFLILNTKKTKEMIIDFRKASDSLEPISIDNDEIEIVTKYKYLGTVLDSKLSWNDNVDYLYKKGQQRLFFLRRLNKFGIDCSLMALFYKTFIQSILTFNLLCWFGNLSVQNKNKLYKIVNIARKIIGSDSVTPISFIYEQQIVRKVNQIVSDSSHTLHYEFEFLPSGRRFRMPKTRTNRFRHSFVPAGVHFSNIS